MNNIVNAVESFFLNWLILCEFRLKKKKNRMTMSTNPSVVAFMKYLLMCYMAASKLNKPSANITFSTYHVQRTVTDVVSRL